MSSQQDDAEGKAKEAKRCDVESKEQGRVKWRERGRVGWERGVGRVAGSEGKGGNEGWAKE